MIISGSRDNSVMCWDGRSKAQEAVQCLNDAKDSISSLRVSDHEILSASFDGKVRTYDIRVGELCADYMGGKYKVIKKCMRGLYDSIELNIKLKK